MTSEAFSFKGKDGQMLNGRLERPVGPARAAALFAHCFTCGKDIFAARRISRRLAGAGIAVLRFDFTGLGHSDGEFANSGFSGNVDDLQAAAAAMADAGLPPNLLVGHSLGGSAVIAAAGGIASVKAVATINAPADPGHVTHNFDYAEIEAEGEAQVTLGGRDFTISRAFLHDLRQSTLTDHLRGLHRALLILHSPTDAIVGIDNASALFTAARHPKSFVTLDGADHLLSRAEDADYAANTIATWAERYLDMAPAAPDPAIPEGITRVVEADPNGFLQDVHLGRHHLKADEPASFGGTDLGPSPYQYLAAALGACTTMTMRMYARRKGWPLTGLSVDVSHKKRHATDCEDCDKGKKIDSFTREITLHGDLSAEQRARLIEIADKCPVHNTLEAEAQIVTRLVH
ncbi:bifunctional alpha/beta hydrolase/OsmC family protein [Pseudorhodobacter sp.]|uniref:bifunctional alpha/beta hydrolase/OsmC family protein n=1 Tax=Pseudorhodobacter sp. TaxID=1934400 RepID=UPI0026479223|nr:bifunctional alpha/beta hydrolase/OsmC family protein [Pseudorhodobacter sp.]MDN5788501.1 bifunctional alpha/beta hydrolase/OsmC family protein [Pseudorhodobacter sp.]